MKNSNKYQNLTEPRARQLFQDLYRSSLNKFHLFTEARNWLPTSQFFYAISLALRQNRNLPFLTSTVKTLDKLGFYYPFDRVSTKREAEWSHSLIKIHADIIAEYLRLRNEFFDAVLSDRLDDAGQLLDKICESSGYSNWWIKQKIGFLQYHKGLEAQKQFSAWVKTHFSPNSVQAFIAHQVSVRNEPSITPSKFLKQLNDDLQETSLDLANRQLILYHISGDFDDSVDGAINVLRYSAAESIIDLYEAVINLLKVIVVDESDENILIGRKIVASLSDLFEDDRIDCLSSHFASKFEVVGVSSTRATGLANFGIFNRKVHSGRIDSTLVLDKALSQDFSSKGEFIDLLVRYLESVISKDKNTDAFSTELERICLAFFSFSFFTDIKAVLISELNPDYRFHIAPLSELQQKDYEKVRRRTNFLFSVSKSESEIWNLYLPVELQSSRLFISRGNTENNDGILYRAEYLLIFECIAKLIEGRADLALNAAEKIYRTQEFGTMRMIAFKFTILSLVRLGNISEAICLITEEYVKNESVRHLVSVRDLTDSIDKELRKKLNGQLAIPIMYDIYARHVDGAYASTLKRSVADVLLKNSVNKPSELLRQGLNFTSSSFVYFLRHCCIPENIYATGFFTSSTSLIEERIAVLQQLTTLDRENIDLYQAEIYERTRRMVLDARRAQLEQSKIELNAEGFLRAAEKRVKESYQRYLAFSRIEIPSHAAEKGDLVETNQTANLPALPEKEDKGLFQQILRDLLEIFLYDKYSGLDGLIGTRIRHNVFESELRSPLVASNLITSRDSEGNYNVNHFWLQDFIQTEPELAVELNSIFGEFSANYDSLLLEIKNEWIQIKSQNHENGLIDVTTNVSNFDQFEKLIKDISLPFSLFAEEIFNIFSGSLEPSLALLRERLERVGKLRSIELLDSLEKSLRNLSCLPKGLIDEILNARTGILRAFDRVIEWFRPTYENSSEPINFEDVFEICLEIVKRYYPSFQVNINLGDTGNALIPGFWIRGLTDMLIVLFDNAVKHSGIFPSPTMDVSASFANSVIRVTATNKLSKNKDLAEIRAKTESILSNIENKSYKDELKRENGTGIYRLHDSIINIVKLEPEISINVSDNRTFTISFNLLTATSHENITN